VLHHHHHHLIIAPVRFVNLRAKYERGMGQSRFITMTTTCVIRAIELGSASLNGTFHLSTHEIFVPVHYV